MTEENFETTELCPHCDNEVIVTKKVDTCSECGKEIVACGMCTMENGCNDCIKGSKFNLPNFRVDVRRSKRGMIVHSFWTTNKELEKMKIAPFTSVYEKKGKRMYKIS